MKTLFAIALASGYGLSIRMLFGSIDDFEIMSNTFLLLAPVIIGFLTVILLPARQATHPTAAFFWPWLTSLVLLVVTSMLNMEGAICWIMIFPLFAIAAGIGGVIAYYFKKAHQKRKQDPDRWEGPERLNVTILFLLPVVLGLIEGERTQSTKLCTVKRSVTIETPPSKVWQALGGSVVVSGRKAQSGLSTAIGFPHHLRTTLDTLAAGGKRVAYYEKGLYFQESITRCIPEQLLVLKIKTDPAGIPATTLDEHIVIGGRHVDILEDTYRLEQLPNGNCRLSLSSNFRISTPFNWYAGIWANVLMKDILEGELSLVKSRALGK